MKKLLICIVAVIAVFSAFCDDDYASLFDNPKTDATSDKSVKNDRSGQDFVFSFSGDHSFQFRFPVIPDHFDFSGNIKAPRFTNEIAMEIKYRELKVKNSFSLDIVLNDFSSWDKILVIRPLENYISWSPWKLKFAVGLQTYSWGTADGMNPTDNINPRDFSRGMDSKKIPVLSALFSMYPVDFFSFDVVYVPFEQSDIFPLDIAGSIPSDAFNGLSLVSLSPLSFSAVSNTKNVNYKNFGFDPGSFLMGGKINFRVPHVDFSFSYLYDYDTYFTPVITLKRDPIQGVIPGLYMYRIDSIELIRNRVHRIGGDLKATAGQFTLWLEMSYSLSSNYLLNDYTKRNHILQWVTGFDFSYGPNNDFYFNFQYIGEFVPLYYTDFYRDYKNGQPDSTKIDDESYMKRFYYRSMVDKLGSIDAGLLQGLSVEMKWPVLDNLLEPSMTAAYFLPLLYDYGHEIRYGSLYMKPALDIMPIDSFHIKLGVELFFSWHKIDDKVELVTNDRIGTFYKDSSIFAEVSYKWGVDIRK
jgi:hypothetical protein